ncbi:MAG: MerR family transcriptional regulator [Actinobacteria bacterium]|nr:MerR family transcriptional regulator [Actinomycetota bacterium]
MTAAFNYLSIGEVLALLLEDFPDVTISKIRFLESQGLIEPERTASGYRKFSQAEVDRLKFILREQRENFTPLKVIRTRLDHDTSTEMMRVDDTTAPRGLAHIPTGRINSHPAGQAKAQTPPPLAPTISLVRQLFVADPKIPRSFDRSEIISTASIDEATLVDLEHFGILRSRRVGVTDLYDEIDLEILLTAAKFLSLGFEARHLKTWKNAAMQEVSLFETRIVPMMRQRNPTARQEALAMLNDLVEQGGRLRAAFISAQSRDHIESR